MTIDSRDPDPAKHARNVASARAFWAEVEALPEREKPDDTSRGGETERGLAEFMRTVEGHGVDTTVMKSKMQDARRRVIERKLDPTPGQLAEADERATPEDTSFDPVVVFRRGLASDFSRLARAAVDSGENVHDLETLASSEVVQAIVDLRLATERERMAQDHIHRVTWVGLGAWVAGLIFGLALGLWGTQ